MGASAHREQVSDIFAGTDGSVASIRLPGIAADRPVEAVARQPTVLCR